ncbi:MAG: SAM-dependent methyltransferase [Actinomycetota bacterium]
MTPTVVPASFRDPAGFVWADGDAIYRHVGLSHRDHYDALVSSGLYGALVGEGLMIEHAETDVPSPRPDAYKVLRPEVVEFISYPYEWSFSQLKDAARLTLEIQKRALDHGMSLRDASAYNVQFHRGRPVLIDTLSFEILPEGRPWIAYRQFCQHFLAPLALMAYRDVRFGQLARTYIDGVPLDLAARLLPRRTRFKGGLLAHIHTQARIQSRHDRAAAPPTPKEKSFSLQAFRGIVWSLERTVAKLEWKLERTPWSDYYQEADHYSTKAEENKRAVVGRFLHAAGGRTVWDLGGNIGVFSREASKRGRQVVSFDIDPGCVEMNYRQVVESKETNVLPLLNDLRNPSPHIGWASRERSSLTERGPADVAMALALIHHLAIGNNVPLDMMASYFAELAKKLIIEFVPKTDEMVKQLLALRSDVFPHYDESGFEEAFGRHFEIEGKESLADTERVLYLMRRK